MSLNDRLRVHAEENPDKTAIEFDDQELNFYQLSVLIDQTASYFDSLGLTAGDRVAILALNHPDWFIALFAAARTGVILVPMNWRLSLDELDFVVQDSAPILLLHDKAFDDTANALCERYQSIRAAPFGSSDFPPISLAPERDNGKQDNDKQVNHKKNNDAASTDPLLIVYTSGTTGRPKGAVLSQKSLLCSADMSCHMLDLQATDRVLNVLPLFHVGGLNIQPLPALLNGATLILPERFEPEATVRALREQNITLMTVVPTVLQAMLASDKWDVQEFGSLRALSIGSTDVPVSLINQVQKDNIPVLQVYGATETSPVAIYQRVEDADKVGSIGRAGKLCSIKLVDKNGDEVAVGESGEILCKGDNILSTYWSDEVASDESIKDGWFKTGDVAHQDKDGYYWFDDRLKHVIISGGENIYPAELERVIGEVDGVIEHAVVGRTDAQWGEVPVAVIAGYVDRQLVLDACAQLARYKQPRDVVYVDTLPRNALGKVLVGELRRIVG